MSRARRITRKAYSQRQPGPCCSAACSDPATARRRKGNIALAGNKAQQEIAANEQMANQNIGEQQTLLAQQLAQQLRQYSASQAADTLAYIDELEAREYDRGTTSQDRSNSLAMQIYQFANQEKQQNQEQQNWLAQFNESVRQYNETAAKSTSSGGGGNWRWHTAARHTPPAPGGSGLLMISTSINL